MRVEDVNPDILHEVLVRFGRAASATSNANAANAFSDLAADYAWFAPLHRAAAEADLQRGAFVAAYSSFKRYLLFSLTPSERSEVHQQLRKLEARQPALGLYGNAEAAARDKRWRDALALLEQVLDMKPRFAVGYRLRGTAFAALGDKRGALEAYDTYLKLDLQAPDRLEVETIIAATQRSLQTPPQQDGPR